MSRLTEKVDQEPTHFCEKCKNVYYCPVHDQTMKWIDKLDTRLWFIFGGTAIAAGEGIIKITTMFSKLFGG